MLARAEAGSVQRKSKTLLEIFALISATEAVLGRYFIRSFLHLRSGARNEQEDRYWAQNRLHCPHKAGACILSYMGSPCRIYFHRCTKLIKTKFLHLR